jgi:hypothetical protein
MQHICAYKLAATYKMTFMYFLVRIHINNQSTLYKVNGVAADTNKKRWGKNLGYIPFWRVESGEWKWQRWWIFYGESGTQGHSISVGWIQGLGTSDVTSSSLWQGRTEIDLHCGREKKNINHLFFQYYQFAKLHFHVCKGSLIKRVTFYTPPWVGSKMIKEHVWSFFSC